MRASTSHAAALALKFALDVFVSDAAVTIFLNNAYFLRWDGVLVQCTCCGISW